jgi:hypothetical protein
MCLNYRIFENYGQRTPVKQDSGQAEPMQYSTSHIAMPELVNHIQNQAQTMSAHSLDGFCRRIKTPDSNLSCGSWPPNLTYRNFKVISDQLPVNRDQSMDFLTDN